MPSRRQHSKGKNRPRSWHHGAAQGKHDEERLLRALPALERAADEEAQRKAQAKALRRGRAAARRDELALLNGLSRIAPSVPAWP